MVSNPNYVAAALTEMIDLLYSPNVADLPPDQADAMRNAFFAGVHWMQGRMPAELLSPGDDVTEADMAVFQNISDEIQAMAELEFAFMTKEHGHG